MLIRSLLTNTALGRTFELIADEGEEPTDWAELFGATSQSSGVAPQASERSAATPSSGKRVLVA
jgi:hypothetical protein